MVITSRPNMIGKLNFSDFFVGGYINLKIFKENPGSEVGRFHVFLVTSNGVT